MERLKRPQNDADDELISNNKKQKFENPSIFFRSHLENLPNEIVYEIFEYLDVYHIYLGFFYLNQRFKNLIIHPNLPIQINIPTISKSNFDLYHKNLIKPNKHRINSLRLSNPFTVDIIFSPPRIISDFIQLETLILDNIDAKYLSNILKHSVYLPKLESLILTPIDYVQNPGLLFSLIFLLPKLKSCKLTYQTKFDPQPFYFTGYPSSPIESFVINARFPIDSLHDILVCLPKLHYLSIDCLVGSNGMFHTRKSIVLKSFKHLSIQVDSLHFHILSELIKSYFRSIEILHITTHDPTYLSPNRWEELILSSMPNLRIFDIHHMSILQKTQLIYLLPVYQFDYSFWSQRKWFFIHNHSKENQLDRLWLYSINPYRRKDYKFYSGFPKRDKQKNFNSVEHLHLCSLYGLSTSVDYFPNVNQLTIEIDFKIFDDFMSNAFNRILPIKQVTKLVIQNSKSPFEQIIKLIGFMPNLHELKLDLLVLNGKNWKLIEHFQHVSNTNKITNFELGEKCTLENFQMIMNLFPQVEYLKIGMNRKAMHHIIRFLFSKTCRLVFLCISKIPKVRLRELNRLIRLENLLKDYSIKYINYDLYLWW